MNTISVNTRVGKVEGTCDAKFSGVLDAFVTNFEARGEVGASCTLTIIDQSVAFDTVLTRLINYATNYICNECGRTS